MTKKERNALSLVTTGLDPVVHADPQQIKGNAFGSDVATWIAGSSPAMTKHGERLAPW